MLKISHTTPEATFAGHRFNVMQLTLSREKFSEQYSATKRTIHQLSENFINVLQIFTAPLTELFCNFLKSLFISILENFISLRLSLVALGIVPSATTTTGKSKQNSMRSMLHRALKNYDQADTS